MEKRDQSVVQILSLSLEFLEGGSFFGRLSRYSKGFIFLLAPKSHNLPPFVIETKQRNQETYKRNDLNHPD